MDYYFKSVNQTDNYFKKVQRHLYIIYKVLWNEEITMEESEFVSDFIQRYKEDCE